jgi:predicted AAA+ superfamily ATPase
VKYLRRRASARLATLLRTFPAVLVVGPRQSGKSTLAAQSLPGWTTMDLERPSDAAALAADLEGFLEAHPRRVVFDEAQRVPALFPALRHTLDRSHARGRYVLLGSASPPLLETASESLAGRLGVLELTPLTSTEVADSHFREHRWFWGGYPALLRLRSRRARGEWLEAYISAFLERDLPTLGVTVPSARLRLLWTMLTHVHGNLLNVADLARSLSVSAPTVNASLDVLESTFMIRRLRPYFANIQKRLTKSPKLYVRDTGLLHALAGLRDARELAAWARRGASFEGLVIEELVAQAALQAVRPEWYFWRTQAGAEVDLLLVAGRRMLPVEIKLGATVDQYSLAGLRQCMKDLSLKRGWVVCRATERRTLGRGIEVVPWTDVAAGRVELPFS